MRIHSPVILIEFDHIPGVIDDNTEPTVGTFTPSCGRRMGTVMVPISCVSTISITTMRTLTAPTGAESVE